MDRTKKFEQPLNRGPMTGDVDYTKTCRTNVAMASPDMPKRWGGEADASMVTQQAQRYLTAEPVIGSGPPKR